MEWSWLRSRPALEQEAKKPAYASLLQKYRVHVDYWEENFSESPAAVTGWLHFYVCPHCSQKLIYDPRKPYEHVCPLCGKAAPNTPEILGAWQYCRRYDIEMTLQEAAVLYCVEHQQKDYDFILRVVDDYARHYQEFDEHGQHAGRGRIMGQSLDEAVWAIYVMRALMMIGFDGKSEMGQRWLKTLFLPLSRLVAAQSNTIHNIPLWHEACAFCTGLFFGDLWLADRTYGGDLGLEAQILRGFTDDGIWHENSTGYHFYSVTAATYACLFARSAGMQERYPAIFARVVKAYTAPLALRFRSGELPAFNDCSKEDSDHAIETRLDLYIEAARIFDNIPGAEAIADVVGEFDSSGNPAMLLFPVSAARKAPMRFPSVNLSHNHLAMLRNDSYEVFCKYGNLGPSHAHADALEISLPPFSFDPGNPNYGSPLYRGWYTQTMAHNTFAINGASQNRVAAGTGHLTPDGLGFDMEIKGTYPGVSARRTLQLTEQGLADEMQVSCGEECVIDWFFHSDGDFTAAGDVIPASLPVGDGPYSYMTDVRQLVDPSEVHFALGKRTLTVRFEALPEQATVFVAHTPGNPAIHSRTTLMVRCTAGGALFRVAYRMDKA